MRLEQTISETAVKELARKLPSLSKHDYDTIDRLVRGIAAKHAITKKALHDLFVRQYKATPDSWIKSKLDEIDKDKTNNLDIEKEVEKFVAWAAPKLHLKNIPNIVLSDDTENAQKEHHTGEHDQGSNNVWVYAKNRNLVDILRTVFHELVHCRQGEIGMLKPGCSYPGSPVEAMADMVAGKYIKLYGEQNRYIFQ